MSKPGRIVAAGAIALWALTTVGVDAQRTADDPSTARYRGRVMDAPFGAPLPGVDVTCTTDGGVVHRAKTDDKGDYALASTTGATGACEVLEFALKGFAAESFRYPSRGLLDVSLDIGSLANWEPVGAWPRGLVVNADGTPAVDASVWLWRVGGARTNGWRTDSAGTFEMPVFPDVPGDYALCARGAGERQRAACLAFNAEPLSGGRPRLQLPPRSK
ncbi:MAG: carboxypeptidase-like regulatory domain-containing protein [Vicinamibacteraceae bacterium]